MKQQRGTWLAAPILGALTWFGFHCGSGFASGSQMKIYAIKYGAMGLLAPLVAWVSCTVFIGIITEYARLIQAKSYCDVGKTIYWDDPVVGRVAILVWDIMLFFAMVVSAGACVSGLGTLLKSLLGFPYFVGCAAFVIFMVVLMCFGDQILSRLGKFSIPLIVMFLAVSIIGIAAAAPNLQAVLTTDLGASSVEGATPGTVAWSGFTYGCIQISFLHTASIIGGTFKSRKQTWAFVASGFIINCGCMLLGVLAILAYYPACMSSEMPMLYITTSFSGPLGTILLLVYHFILFMAYITTAGSLLAGSIARYTPMLKKVVPHDLACKAIVVVVIMSGAALLSALGLEGVLTKGYGTLAKLKMPLWFFPILVLGPISIRRVSKRQKAEAAMVK